LGIGCEVLGKQFAVVGIYEMQVAASRAALTYISPTFATVA
jgi:hypothetical protein